MSIPQVLFYQPYKPLYVFYVNKSDLPITMTKQLNIHDFKLQHFN